MLWSCPADVVAKAVDAACAMKLWRPAALVTVAGLATDAALLDALAEASVGLRDRFDGAQRGNYGRPSARACPRILIGRRSLRSRTSLRSARGAAAGRRGRRLLR